MEVILSSLDLNLGKGVEGKENTIELQLYSKYCFFKFCQEGGSMYLACLILWIATIRKINTPNKNDGLRIISLEHGSDLSSLDLSPGNGVVGQESTIELQLYPKSLLKV